MNKSHEEELLESAINNTLNPLQDEDTFIAGCKQCGKCCRNRNDIILNAFDVFHIAQATGKTMREVADKYGESYIGESSGMPLIVLKYRKDSFGDGTTCYFLGKKDNRYYCRTNDKKPYVCKTFPLERLLVFDKKEKEDAFAPIYHTQHNYKEYSCLGIKDAIKNNQTHTVVEWVGGKEKKEMADAFWKIYTKFLYDLDNIINIQAFLEHKDQTLVDRVMEYFFKSYYLDYDHEGTEDEFLRQYKNNTEDILQIFQALVQKLPQYSKTEKRKEKNNDGNNAGN